MRIKWNLCLGLLALSLTACQERNISYSYLMLHPDLLQRLYNGCVQEVADPTLPCQTILRAQSDFTALVNQREQGPERFGAKVLQAQEYSVALHQKYDSVLQAYETLGAQKPGLEEIKKMRLQLDDARGQYLQSEEVVKIFLSVIAATSAV